VLTIRAFAASRERTNQLGDPCTKARDRPTVRGVRDIAGLSGSIPMVVASRNTA
jgi:hypothetical protein